MGITVEFTAPYFPFQNRRAERAGGVIMAHMRALVFKLRLPKQLWPEMVKAAVYLINRLPMQIQDWKTPLEIL